MLTWSPERTSKLPGEKLFEEISTLGEELMPTAHSNVSVFRGGVSLSHRELCQQMDRLRLALDRRSVADALEILERIVPDYTASTDVQTLAARCLDEAHPFLRLA